MTATNRVDELRKRYHENPRRFFAPLANEYRKTGFVDRAILLCEKHLGEQPGNMNGLVVYGQCLFETGRLEEARGPFEMALGLDPENLIALRHLGDIARLAGDQPTARTWYEKLLEVDRRNDEVIALLAEVGGGGANAPAPVSQAPSIISVASSVSIAGEVDSFGTIDLAPTAPHAPVAAPPPRTATPPRAAPSVDPTAKTVEVAARPSTPPPRRASLLDVSFDFGEVVEAVAPPPAPPAPPAPAPEVPLSMGSLIEASPEGESLGETAPIEGLLQADFSAEVAPLSDLESTEFQTGEAEPLAELEAMDFQPPTRDTAAIEGLEPAEFTPPSFATAPIARLSSDIELSPDDAFGLSMAETPDAPLEAAPVDEPAWPTDLGSVDGADDAVEFAPESRLGSTPEPDEAQARRDLRASVAGLPLLEPFGTPTPMATPAVDESTPLPSLEEAETLQMDVETMRQRMEVPPTFVTETMAQVYVQQGHTEKAIAVYKQLVSQAPDDEQLLARLRALESPIPEVPAAPPARPSLGFDTPLSTEPVDEPAPANAMLSAMSFDGLSLSTPEAPSRLETPVGGPSAREFFSSFLHRAATPVATPAVTPVGSPGVSTGPSAAGALLSPLDEIFGTTVRPDDEAAAHRLAGVGATSGPSGGSALDSLFGEGPSAPMPTSTPSRGSVTRASEKLRFDQFFASSTPIEGSAAAPDAPQPEPRLPMDDASESAVEDAGEDDDLDQFQGWLRGLTS